MRAQCFPSLGQIVAPAGELALDDGQVHVEDAPSSRSRCRQSPSDGELGGGLVEYAVEDAVHRKRGREVPVAHMGVGREHASSAWSVSPRPAIVSVK